MNKKKIISIVLSLVILMSALAVITPVSAEEKTYGTFDDFETGFRFSYLDQMLTTFRIDGFMDVENLPNQEYPEIINIPETIGNAIPVSIDNNAFVAVTSTSVVIPSTITSIGNYAFANSKLTSVTIPSTVSTIGNYAFLNCKDLTTAALTSNIENMGTNLFENCSILENVTLAPNTTTIPSSMFKNCTNLFAIDIPSSVKSIGANAFFNCSLTGIFIPENVETIGIQAVGFIDNSIKKDNFTIYSNSKDGAAYAYATENGFDFKSTVTRLYGDTTFDNKISLNDVLEASKHLTKIIELTGNDFKATDVNGDNKISLQDILEIQLYLVKIKPEFTVGVSFEYIDGLL